MKPCVWYVSKYVAPPAKASAGGRNALSWEERFKLDVWYVDHRTFWLDLRILGMTIRKVLVRDGISAQGDATMPRFTGT